MTRHLNDLRGATFMKILTSAFGADGMSWCGVETTVHNSATESQIAHVTCIACLEAFAEWHLHYVDAALEVRDRVLDSAEAGAKPS